MAKVCKYYTEQQLISYDCGESWVQQDEFRKGDLYEINSEDCGFMLIYRWALSPGDYECISIRKYDMEVLQYTTEQGGEYQNVVPEYKRRMSTPSDYLSVDCGYVESTGGFKFSGTSVVECGNRYGTGYTTEYLAQGEIRGKIAPHSIVGDCTEVIGAYAFSGSVVEQVDISSYVNKIEAGAFSSCSGLTDITIPDSVEDIYAEAFYGSSNLSGVTLPSGLTYIADGLFMYTSITGITLPSTVKLIGNSAFASSSANTPLNITLPQTLTDLGGFAFSNRTLPNGFTLPDSIKYLTCEIPDGLEFPPYLEHIGDTGGYGSYNNYYNVTSVPGTVKLITGYAGINSGATLSEGIECIAGGWDGEDIPNSVNFVSTGYEEGVGFHRFGCIVNATSPSRFYAYGEYIYPTNAQVVSAEYSRFGGTILTFNSTIPPLASLPSNTACVFVPDASVGLYKAMWDDLEQYIYPLSYKQYEWRQMSIEDGYECVGVDKHYREHKFISLDSGQTWYDTCLSRVGSLYEANSVDCGYIPQNYTLKLTFNDGKSDSATSCDTTTVPVHSGDTTIETISIGECARVVPDNCFGSCHNATSLTISEGVTTIGNKAFDSCVNITSVTIPNSVSSMGNSAFTNCISLSSCTIGSGVTAISEYAFFVCSNLESISIGSNVTSIGEDAFYKCTSLTSITIPNSVTYIYQQAFYGCSGLTSVVIPSGVTRIYDSAFSGCSSLTSLTIENGVTYINAHAFSNCSNLTEVTIPDSVVNIGGDFLSMCSSLTSVTIGNGVEYIDSRPFDWCNNLQWVKVYATTPPGGSRSDFLRNSNNCPIYVPAESVNSYKSAFPWRYYSSRIQAMPTP